MLLTLGPRAPPLRPAGTGQVGTKGQAGMVRAGAEGSGPTDKKLSRPVGTRLLPPGGTPTTTRRTGTGSLFFYYYCYEFIFQRNTI